MVAQELGYMGSTQMLAAASSTVLLLLHSHRYAHFVWMLHGHIQSILVHVHVPTLGHVHVHVQMFLAHAHIQLVSIHAHSLIPVHAHSLMLVHAPAKMISDWDEAELPPLGPHATQMSCYSQVK